MDLGSDFLPLSSYPGKGLFFSNVERRKAFSQLRERQGGFGTCYKMANTAGIYPYLRQGEQGEEQFYLLYRENKNFPRRLLFLSHWPELDHAATPSGEEGRDGE